MEDLKNLTNKQLLSLKGDTEARVSQYNNGQLALKYLMNGCYGAFGSPYFRYFNIKIATAITLSGQLAIKWIEDYLMNHPKQAKYKWDVMYIDTDSIYVSISNIYNMLSDKIKSNQQNSVDKINEFSDKIIQPIINEGYEKLAKYVQANENRMFMKREKVSIKSLWVGKKKYALHVLDNEGVRYTEPKLKVKGIEIIQSSTPKFVRERLKNIVELILTDPEKLSDLIEKTRKDFLELEPEDIARTSSVNTMNKYETIIKNGDGTTMLHYKKKCPMAVRASIMHNKYVIYNDLYNKFPEINEGDKVKYVFMKLPNPIHENVFGFLKNMPDKDKLKQYVDYKMQFEKVFLTPIYNITDKIRMMIKNNYEIDLNELF